MTLFLFTVLKIRKCSNLLKITNHDFIASTKKNDGNINVIWEKRNDSYACVKCL